MIFPDEGTRAAEFNRLNYEWHERHAQYITQENGEFIGHTAFHFFRLGSAWAIQFIKDNASGGFDEWLSRQCLTECLDRDDLQFIENENGDQFVSLDEVDRAVNNAAETAYEAATISSEARHLKELEALRLENKELRDFAESITQHELGCSFVTYCGRRKCDCVFEDAQKLIQKLTVAKEEG